MNDAENKLKNVKLPDIKLEKHKIVFFRWLSAPRSTASLNLNIFANMIKIREIVMVLLIVALTVANFWNLGKPYDVSKVERAFAAQIKEVQEKVAEVVESVAALRPDNLVITPLFNNIATRAGDFDVIEEYEKGVAIFAVLPAGLPPYTWSIDDPALMELKPTAQGFLVKGAVKRTGKTVLRVKDSSGLTGELSIFTNPIALPAPSLEAPPDQTLKQIQQLQQQIQQLQQSVPSN